MSDSLATATVKTYLASALADVTTQAILAGVQGDARPLDLSGAFLGGLQTGTTFAASPIAAVILKRAFPADSFAKNPWFNYAAMSVISSGIIASVNYPIAKAAESRTTRNAQYSLKEFAGAFVDQLVPNIAFPVVSDGLGALLPPAKNSLAAFARRSAINGAASFGSVLANAPIAAVKDGVQLSAVAAQAVGAVVPGIILSEAFESASAIVGIASS
jgi:hypothetical protein